MIKNTLTDTNSTGDIDALKTPQEAAKWIGLTERVFLANVRRKKIPCVRINQRVLRFHLPSVLEALQTKGGAR